MRPKPKAPRGRSAKIVAITRTIYQEAMAPFVGQTLTPELKTEIIDAIQKALKKEGLRP